MKFVKVIIAVLIVAALYYYLSPKDNSAETKINPSELTVVAVDTPTEPIATGISVSVMRSMPQKLQNSIILRGSSAANRRVEIKSQTNGLVIESLFNKGDLVKQGELLCELEIGDLNAQLNEARARHEQAKTDESAASRLSKKGFASEMAAKAALAELASADASISRIQIDIKRTKIKAPFDGVLETSPAQVGSLLQSGSTCATLIDLTPIKFIGFAQEANVEEISIGSEVSAKLSTGRTVQAEISFVARSGDPETRTFLIEATAANDDLSIRDGLTANIHIPLAEQTAHFIPQSALTLDDNGTLGVRIAENDQAKFIPVEVIKDDSNGIWVSGLADSVDIILVGQEFVRDGTKIITNKIDPLLLFAKGVQQ